jgi:predicted RND superfamily exporter protein
LIVAAAGLLFPFVAWCAKDKLQSNTNHVSDWMPAQQDYTAEYQWFCRQFGNDEFVLIAWEGCTLDDPRLDAAYARLSTLGEQEVGSRLCQRVVTGRSLLNDLMQAPTNLSRKTATKRLEGCLLGRDGEQTCAVVWLTDAARHDIHATLSRIRGAVEACGIPPASIKLGGPPAVNAALDVVCVRSLNQSIALGCGVGLVLAWLSMRDLRLTLLILVTGVYGIAASLAALWLCDVRLNGVIMTMVPLVYVASTSGAIHLCNYYCQSVRQAGVPGAAGRAVAHAMLPLGLATGTTAAGLLSICYTDLVPIQLFGLFSAVGVVLSWLLLIVWLPAALAVFGAKASRPDPVDAVPSSVGLIDTGEAPLPRVCKRLGEAVIRRHGWMVAVGLAVVTLCLCGLPRVNITIDVMREFYPDARIIQDYTWLEERIGPLMPMEVIVRLDSRTCPLTMLDRARLVERAQRRIESLDEVGGTISAATFGPELRGRGLSQVRAVILNKRLNKYRDRLVDTGYVVTGDGEELWRISARLKSLNQVDYGEFVTKLKFAVEQEFQAERDRGVPGISVTYTGVAPVFFKARRSMVDGLIWGLGADLVLIVVTMTVVTWHWSSGLLMLVTSVFPTAIVLGSAGWLGITLDQGAVLAPCVALGVSVDDAIHLLIWFKWGIQHGMNRPQAVWVAWQASARPMYQSWALLGLGMTTLAFSPFVPLLEFGLMMVVMLSASLLGNLLLLPALLAGPLGAAIEAQHRNKQLVAELPTSAQLPYAIAPEDQ